MGLPAFIRFIGKRRRIGNDVTAKTQFFENIWKAYI
jgi:hypothetical protein